LSNEETSKISHPSSLIPHPSKVAAVIVAAGRSTRMAGLDKQFALAGGRPLLAHTVAVFEQSDLIDEYVVVLSAENLLKGRALAFEEGWTKLRGFVIGGARRQDSVFQGLLALADGTHPAPEWVMIHDGARPFVTAQILADGLAAAAEFGSAVAGVPVKDTIKAVEQESGLVRETPPRELLWAIQTPQIFRYDLICAAHRQADASGVEVTDDAMMMELAGQPVKIYRAAYTNLKVTTPDDMALAQSILKGSSSQNQPEPAAPEKQSAHSGPEMRVGQGYDVHRLVEGRPLILGGITVPFELGLDGHSDADVLTHAIINALLGAAGLGDIGRYFPPTDPTYKGISSLQMLQEVYQLVQERGWQLANLDATIAAQRPKLAAHIPAMREKLAHTLEVDPHLLNIKATTTEKLGFVGRMEGLEGQAVVLLSRG
jgi:2-C-methyl-D-erythritol 4-phosphate cytidylyltransferase/2-C-methyl-D-erythritol 2,4-cyclodiphosphate synthase